MGQPAYSSNCFRVLTYKLSFLQQKNMGAPTKIKPLWLRLAPLESVLKVENKEFPTLPEAYNKLASFSNLIPNLALFQVLKYTKDYFLQIFKTV